MGARGILVVTLFGVLALLGCDPDHTAERSRPKPVDLDPPLALVDGKVQVSCSASEGESWPPSAMVSGGATSFDEADVHRLLRRILAHPELVGGDAGDWLPDGLQTEWRVLRDDGDGVTLGLGTWTEQGAGKDGSELIVRRKSGRWTPTMIGQCLNLSPALRDGNAFVFVESARPDPSDPSKITLSGWERQCTGNRDPQPYLHQPIAVETDSSVTVYWTSDVDGDATCPGNRLVGSRTLDLEAPLGSRQLLDGSAYPPTPVNALDQ